MSQIAFLFPGQGSQKVGMGRELFERSQKARDVFNTADDALGFSLTNFMFNGPEAKLTETQFAQPAILTHSIAELEALREEGYAEPDFVAGHSLGEYSALVAASVLSFTDAVRAVHMRGRFMQEAVPIGVGAMAAVLTIDARIVEEVCKSICEDEDLVVDVANYNGPDQTVISGTVEGVERASAILKEKGARRVLPLPVSAPFHSRLMKPAAQKLGEHLASIQFNAPRYGFVNNVRADLEDDPRKIRELLVEQVVAPVRFTQMLMRLKDAGVQNFVEIGPGKVLSGIVRRTLSDMTVENKET